MRHVGLSARAYRVDLRDEGKTLDVGQGSICGSALALALCGDVAWMRYAPIGSSATTAVSYVGFTIGFATLAVTKSGT